MTKYESAESVPNFFERLLRHFVPRNDRLIIGDTSRGEESKVK